MTLWEGYSNERCPNESESLIGEGRGEVTITGFVNGYHWDQAVKVCYEFEIQRNGTLKGIDEPHGRLPISATSEGTGDKVPPGSELDIGQLRTETLVGHNF